MDVATFSSELVAWLAPFLPFLLKFGEETAEEAGRRFGTQAWEHANALWERLGGRLEQRPAAVEAVRDAAEAPEDDDARAALRLQVRKLLASDQALAEELGRLLAARPDASGPSTNVAAIGERSIAVGRDATRSTLTTGDEVARPE